MQPYVVKQGDFLALLAYKFQFDASSVWTDPANAELRAVRPDPNQLLPTDVLQIPDETSAQPKMHDLNMGQTNTFTSDPPKVTVSIKFVDAERASTPFTVRELPQLADLHTDSDGMAKFSVPISQGSFTIVFDDASFACRLGHLDPINTFTGVVQRLQNLGYLDPDSLPSLSEIDDVRIALRVLKRAQSSSPDDASSGDPDDAVRPEPADNAGMSDDGAPSDDTQKMLSSAHGC